MSTTRHTFLADGRHIGSGQDTLTSAALAGTVVIDNKVAEYPWPIKLEEGVIVQDTDQVPFEGKWRPAEEAQAMKAEREKAAKS